MIPPHYSMPPDPPKGPSKKEESWSALWWDMSKTGRAIVITIMIFWEAFCGFTLGSSLYGG